MQARNIVGNSSDSSTVSILAALVPATPDAPATALIESDIVVTWIKPATMGSEITSYKIYLQDSNSNWQQTPSCDGTASPVVTSKSCTIPITVLTATPFSLAGQAVVNAKITATNGIGESLESPSGNGGFIAEVPGAPTTVAPDSAYTSHTQVTFTWATPASNGGSAVIDYKVFWDQGTSN